MNYMGVVRNVKNCMNKLKLKFFSTLTQNSPLDIITYGRSCCLEVHFNNKTVTFQARREGIYMSKTVVRKMNLLTMLFVASNVPFQKQGLYKNLANVNFMKTKCET